MDAPDQQPDVVDGMLSRMSHQQKVELYQALLADKDGHPLPDTPAAKVVQTMQLEAKAAVLSKLVEENNR